MLSLRPRLVRRGGVARIVIAAIVAVVLVVGAVLWLVARLIFPELGLRLQPDPNRLAESVAAMQALTEQGQPPEIAGQRDGYELLNDAVALQAKIDGATWRSRLPQGSTVQPIFGEAFDNRRSESRPEDVAGLALAREALTDYREGGLFEAIDAVAAAPRAVRRTGAPGAGLLLEELLPQLGQTRQLTRICSDQARDAINRGDRAAFLRSIRQILGLARVTALQPMLIERLVAHAVAAVALSRTRELLRETKFTPDDDRFLGALSSALRDVERWPSPAMPIEAERLVAVDAIRYIYSTDGPGFREKIAAIRSLQGGPSADLGMLISFPTRAEQLAEIERRYDAFKEAAAAPAATRHAAMATALASLSTPSVRTALLDIMTPALGHYTRSVNQLAVEIAGVRTMIALERARLRAGDYPSTLAALPEEEGFTAPSANGFVLPLAIDPFTDKPLGYTRLAPGQDPAGRRYMLWSTGPDGVDHGGVGPEDDGRFRVLSGEVKNADFMINWAPNEPKKDGGH